MYVTIWGLVLIACPANGEVGNIFPVPDSQSAENDCSVIKVEFAHAAVSSVPADLWWYWYGG
jgi:hypothetical protein